VKLARRAVVQVPPDRGAGPIHNGPAQSLATAKSLDGVDFTARHRHNPEAVRRHRMSDDLTWFDVLDHIDAAYAAGYDTGYARGQMAASEDLADHWLHELAVRWTSQALKDAALLEKWEAGREAREAELAALLAGPKWPAEAGAA
jgi:hypothetical protein